MRQQVFLGSLKKGTRARIISVKAPTDVMERNFLEMGLIEGGLVRVVHEAPFGGDPIAIEVRGALLAIRRQEAAGILVEEVGNE